MDKRTGKKNKKTKAPASILMPEEKLPYIVPSKTKKP